MKPKQTKQTNKQNPTKQKKQANLSLPRSLQESYEAILKHA